MYSKEEIQAAKKIVKKKKDFYQHLVSYVIVSVFFIFVNLLTSPTKLWFYFPMLGWGIGLMFHYVDVFGIPGFGMLDKEWEKQELDNELRKIRNDFPSKLEESTQESLEKKEELKLKELRRNYDDSDFV